MVPSNIMPLKDSEKNLCSNTELMIMPKNPLIRSSTPVNESNTSQSGNVQTEKTSSIECIVCGDKSSGKHYGQFTCEGVLLDPPRKKINHYSEELLDSIEEYYRNDNRIVNHMLVPKK
ncbi:nuclear receptor subfamily 2 group F member 5-like isoform X1 [Phymastichus coffea]|uniref:nuclear receptor subfamily 2 group F member 5-like isoform X1 n=1 Tax=Phymastichus coffea TaxID=108790 RepID=UPI00273C3443|nr:nuclear receptor subfamily 2 group F member 5-like isoform X1 [Phymastichus coffea]